MRRRTAQKRLKTGKQPCSHRLTRKSTTPQDYRSNIFGSQTWNIPLTLFTSYKHVQFWAYSHNCNLKWSTFENIDNIESEAIRGYSFGADGQMPRCVSLSIKTNGRRRRCSIHFGIWYAFFFYGILWRQFGCSFGLSNVLRCYLFGAYQPVHKSLLYLSQTSLVLHHRLRRNGRLGWIGHEIRTRNLESGSRDSQHLLRLRYLPLALLTFHDR